MFNVLQMFNIQMFLLFSFFVNKLQCSLCPVVSLCSVPVLEIAFVLCVHYQRIKFVLFYCFQCPCLQFHCFHYFIARVLSFIVFVMFVARFRNWFVLNVFFAKVSSLMFSLCSLPVFSKFSLLSLFVLQLSLF